MKPYYFILTFLLFVGFTSCSVEDDIVVNTNSSHLYDLMNVQLIDHVDSKQLEVTTKYLKEKWERQSLEEGYDVEYETFEIVVSIDAETQEKHYFLKAISQDKTTETGAFITKLDDYTYALGGKECTCTGCLDGCNLIVEGTDCKCTSCAESEGDCKLTMKNLIQITN